MPELKVYLLNTWSGLTYQGLIKMKEYEASATRELRFSALIEDIKAHAPDLVLLGEANPMPAYGRRLSLALSMDFCWHMGVSGLRVGPLGLPSNLREGDLIAARHGLSLAYLKRRQLAWPGFCENLLSCHFDNITQAVLARVTLPDGETVYVCATHWTAHPSLSEETQKQLPSLAREWGFEERDVIKTRKKLEKLQKIKLREAQNTLRFLREAVPPEAPLILAGDFNSEPSWPELQLLLQDGFCPVPRTDPDKFTWDMEKNRNLKTYYLPETKRRQRSLYHQLDAKDEETRRDIDHIFLKNIPIKGCGAKLCACPKTGVPPSDHFGLFARISWG